MRIALIGPLEEPFRDDVELEHRERMLRTYQDICANIVVFGTDYTASREFLGIEYLAAALRNHRHEVRVVSCANEGWDNRDVTTEMARFRPEVVGISLLYDLQLFNALALARSLKNAFPATFVVFGGPLASVVPELLMENVASIDGLIQGEGEAAIVELAQALEERRDLDGVPRLYHRVDGTIRKNPPGLPLDLDTLPHPSRDVIASMVARGLPVQSAYLTTSRGCKAYCTFCTVPNIVRGFKSDTYRFRDPESVADEMQAIVSRHGVNRFYMADDNFIGYGPESKARMLALADAILRRGLDIRFHAECRVDSLDRDVLRRLRSAGFDQILLGLESGSDKTLRRWAKGQTVAQNVAAIDLARALGFDLVPSMILLDWESTTDEVAETVAFIERTRIYACGQPLSLVNKLKVHCGTAAGRRYEKVHGAPPRPKITDDESLRRWTEAVTYQYTPIDDPFVAAFWRALTQQSNRWSLLLDEIIPALYADMRRALARDERSDHLALLRRIRGFRQSLGGILVGLMRLLIDAAREDERTGRAPAGLDDLARRYAESRETAFFSDDLFTVLRDSRQAIGSGARRGRLDLVGLG